ncbi:protein FAR1-RELATED SEQUENCE 5-like [Lolium perenne]|uniref:protein FAR1-RELATED SEQUENCE 5-like n=1 Tax=Lolium perenne TaxID=4522 RepID=UPI003A9A4CA7
MENSISGMIEEQNEYVGYNSDDSEMEENLQHEAGWSEDEFDIAYDEFDNDDNHGEHTDDQNDENHGEHTDSLNTSEAQFDTQLEYDYYGESDLDTGHTDDVEGASVPEDSVDMSQATPGASQPKKPHKGSNSNEYPDSDRDLYWMIKEMTFISEAAAYSFYNRYAKDYGFSVRLDQVKRFDDGVIRLRRFVCSRQGRRPKNQLTTEGRVYRHRPESRCGCKARLVVKFDGRTGFWVVEDFRDKHNHDPAEPCQTPFLRSHRTINDAQRSEILSMGSMGIRKHLIMRKFIAGSGSFAGVGFTRKDLYNMCSRERRRLLFDGDATKAIRIMSKRKKRDPEFFFEYDVDEKGRLKHMFWCDSQSRRDYQDYGDVLVFDSTYKMNKYKMPFVPFVGLNNHRRTTVFGCAILSSENEQTYVWLLKTFLKAMCQQKPKAVITDADAAMIAAIGEVFSGVPHRICSFHIEKNMEMHLSNKSLNEFRTLLYYTTSEQVFEERWHAFYRKWQSPKTRTWMKRMYTKRKLWAAAYLSQGFWLGMKSNQRSESLNSCLHLHLDGEMTIVDMIMHYDNAIVRLRENEAHDDCTASQTTPVAITNFRELEVAAAKIFTPAVFYIIQGELSKIGGIEILEKMQAGDSNIFIVAWRNNVRTRFYVEYRPKEAEIIRCSCQRMIRKGIPCKHILHVLHFLKFTEIPQCCALRRFTKNARLGLPAKRTSDMFGWGWSGAEERMKYSRMNIKVSQAMHIALNNSEEYDLLNSTIDGIISRREGYAKGKAYGPLRSVHENEDASGPCDIVVGDPLKVSTKGAPRQEAQKSPMTKNGRPLGHKERRVQECAAAGRVVLS